MVMWLPPPIPIIVSLHRFCTDVDTHKSKGVSNLLDIRLLSGAMDLGYFCRYHICIRMITAYLEGFFCETDQHTFQARLMIKNCTKGFDFFKTGLFFLHEQPCWNIELTSKNQALIKWVPSSQSILYLHIQLLFILYWWLQAKVH